MALILYSYYRSSAAYRVRIALNLKNLDYAIHPVHLLRDGGEQNQSDYLEINPQGLVPALHTEHGLLTESAAIIEYLEERYPLPHLLPEDLGDRALVRSLAQMIACDIHPLNNLRVLTYLWPESASTEQKSKWYHHWLEKGLTAFEIMLQRSESKGAFCFGNGPGLADLFLIPQVYNALRFGHKIDAYPLIQGIYRNCTAIDAFHRAAPEMQPDSPEAILHSSPRAGIA
ncbi:MAG: maleylacetoacetate isomerase [Gammaproteobacteria bacterium]